jgi:small subunit ribosomal protein S17
MSADTAQTDAPTRGARKERRGVVVSDAMDKTVVVRVDVLKPHPKYKKTMRRSIRLHAKTKRWRVAEIVEVAK